MAEHNQYRVLAWESLLLLDGLGQRMTTRQLPGAVFGEARIQIEPRSPADFQIRVFASLHARCSARREAIRKFRLNGNRLAGTRDSCEPQHYVDERLVSPGRTFVP